MSTPPSWVLAIIYWLHMLATVAWIGSLAAINLLVLPASQRTLKLADQLSFISALQKKLEPLAWFCMGLLVVTGLFQLSTSPHYDGLLSVSTQWSLSILIKHGLAVVMAVVSAIQTWEVLPAIHRTLLRKETADPELLAKLQRRETTLLRVNLILSALILGATAFARAS
ncbi:MAG: CopD family protein [Anaerolineales bacterium]|nr:CopD family protein [Anaerolineales bacterium]